jgi:hypothetical protein
MKAVGAKPKYAMRPIRKKIYNDCIEGVSCNLPLWAQAERARLIRLSQYGGHLAKRHPPPHGIQFGESTRSSAFICALAAGPELTTVRTAATPHSAINARESRRGQAFRNVTMEA